jgi:hypothetical protein
VTEDPGYIAALQVMSSAILQVPMLVILALFSGWDDCLTGELCVTQQGTIASSITNQTG